LVYFQNLLKGERLNVFPHGKNGFIEISKNLAKYRFENFVK